MAKTYDNLGHGDDVFVVVRDAQANMAKVEIVDFTVLGKVDGVRTLDELLRAVNLQEAQVLQSMRKFLALGMVRRLERGSPPPAPQSKPKLAGAARAASPQSTGDEPRPNRNPIVRTPGREEKKAAAPSGASIPQGWPIPWEQFLFDPVELEMPVELELEQRKQVIYYHYHLKRVNYYDLFQVPRTVDARELKRVYFKLSKEFHPDSYFRKQLGPFKGRVEEIFRWLSQAYAVLTDPKKRAQYDHLLGQGLLGDWDPKTVASSSKPTAANSSTMAPWLNQKSNPSPSVVATATQLETLRRRAEQAEQSGEWGQALRFYQAALSQGRGAAPLAHRAARCLLEMDERLEEAERLCTWALAMLVKPVERVDTLLTLAQLMEATDRPLEALRWYREVIQIEPDHPMARLKIGKT
jgi:hypothetical protein